MTETLRRPHAGTSGLTPRWAALAGALTICGTFAVSLPAGRTYFLIFLVAVFFVAATWAFASAPHVAFALSIPVLITLPLAKVFLGDGVGPLKDVLILAAGLALLLSAAGRSLDSPTLRSDHIFLAALGLFALIYLFSPLSPHGSAWFHSARLALEPILLLLAGALIPGNRRRIWEWAQWSMIATCIPVAVYGVLQQALGVERLVSLGYEYGAQVRQIDGSLRSFGTLDEPFSYAAVLALGLTLVVMCQAPLSAKLIVGTPIAVGLACALVRTSVLTCLLLLAVWLLSRGTPRGAALLLCLALAIGGLLLARSEGTETRTVQTASGAITLNGRVGAWEATFQGPGDIPLGRGPGSVGTGAERAADDGTPRPARFNDPASASAVDSGYLAVIADVGLLGLACLLAALARLATQAWSAAQKGSTAAWTTLALIAVLAGDAVTRSSFAAFPTAPIAFLLIGTSIAAALSATTARAGRGSASKPPLPVGRPT